MPSISSAPHRAVLETIRARVAADGRFCGLLIGGSVLHGGFDEYSDLDLVLVTDDAAYDAVMADRKAVAAALGPLLSAFTGEHVGEPRLLICLYGDLPVHVDLKFITADALDVLVERPAILWARDETVGRRLDAARIVWPNRPADWFEDRFWTWVHYGAVKIGRGELFEALSMLDFMRDRVLGPLIHERTSGYQRGLRRIETAAPDWTARLEATLATHDRADIVRALHEAADLYRALRAGGGNPAEPVAMAYLGRIAGSAAARGT